MNYLSEQQLQNLTPCRFEALLAAVNARNMYYQAAEGPQWGREEEERESFKRYQQIVLKENQRRQGK